MFHSAYLTAKKTLSLLCHAAATYLSTQRGRAEEYPAH